MRNINERFKEVPPEKTVENIQNILSKVGIKLTEEWVDSGIKNCYSLRVNAEGGFPGANGKGITKELACASGYAEFIERLQSGLFFYKYQSLECEPGLLLNEYAPDAKYMTKQELVENGEWMDYIVDTYGGNLSRLELAEQCEMYASSEDILTVPFYSLFEDKYVYLPTHFVEHMFAANGCCVGNSREEALVHGLSEIMERNAATRIILRNEAVPVIPEEEINKFPAAKEILEKFREKGLDVSVLDISFGTNFPIVSTVIIDKATGGYYVNFAADPVFEIAISRTLTEVVQGKSIDTIHNRSTKGILKKVTDVNPRHNLLNQIETGNGKFPLDFFVQELNQANEFKAFPDNTNKSNKELLREMLDMFKGFGKPVYVRNYSFLGFPCYMIVVPGFSESRSVRLTEPLQEYAFGANVCKTLRYIERASDDELEELLLFHKFIFGANSRKFNYPYLAGIPMVGMNISYVLAIHLAYAAYRLDRKDDFKGYLNFAKGFSFVENDINYIECILQYFDLKQENISEEKIMLFLSKFFSANSFERLKKGIKDGGFFDGELLRCDMKNCEECAYRENCRLESARGIISRAGRVYREFENGQAKENFVFDF